jgi:serine/threonine-protein kinase
MLVGRPLFAVNAEAAVLSAILSHEPSPVTALRSDVDPAWNDFFARAIARDPRARFPSARAMSEALDQIAGTLSADAGERVAELVEALRGDPAHAADPPEKEPATVTSVRGHRT